MIKLSKIRDDFCIWLMTYARWNAAVLMMLITTEVFMRYVLNNPTIWSLDLQTQISGIGRILPVGYTLMVRSHATIDVFSSKAPLRWQKILSVIGYFGWFFPLIGCLSYSIYGRMIRSWTYKETMYTPWRPVLYPMVTIAFICYILLFIQGLNECMKDIITIKRGETQWLKER
jgi:TRAP-type mannitol/chloroaromatic compound transport system permease small subunit